MAKQKAVDCGQLAPTPVPESIAKVLAGISPNPADQTPEEKALVAWMNHDAGEAENFHTYCKETT